VVESLGAIFVWHDPEGGEPEWSHPSLPQWDDKSWVRGHWDHLGQLNQHPQEVIDNIADYGHLSPIHGSTVDRFEVEFKGHTVTQRQCGGHRTLTSADGSGAVLHTDTTYHGPGVLISYLTGMFETILLITHTPIDDGSIKVWHSLIVKSPFANAEVTTADLVAARQYQESSRLAFAQDFEVWTNKGPCLNGLFIPSDGPFMKVRVWYKQFYNPRATKQEYIDQCEGMYVPKGAVPYTQAA
jgi:3-ketosteroid 9alpha-monooxygenase subunit A